MTPYFKFNKKFRFCAVFPPGGIWTSPGFLSRLHKVADFKFISVKEKSKSLGAGILFFFSKQVKAFFPL
jgi:hypothetical protein